MATPKKAMHPGVVSGVECKDAQEVEKAIDQLLSTEIEHTTTFYHPVVNCYGYSNYSNVFQLEHNATITQKTYTVITVSPMTEETHARLTMELEARELLQRVDDTHRTYTIPTEAHAKFIREHLNDPYIYVHKNGDEWRIGWDTTNY